MGSIETFDKYILVNKIGAGGMGVVFKAYDLRLKKFFAIKIIQKHLTLDLIKRFKREAKIYSRIKHPNIIRVYDIGIQNERHYIVMDYIEGKNLGQVLNSEVKIPPDESLKIILKISNALEYAHKRKIIHRDIKPSNIIIANDRESIPYLTDFGLAITLHGDARITLSGELLGTPRYMSPEQAQGKIEQIDPRSDIYSLGVVLYEMITGRYPFAVDNDVPLLYSVIHESPVPISRHHSTIDKNLEAICLKCMEKEQNLRYQSAEELANDIQKYLKGKGVLARTTKRWCHIQKWLKNTLLCCVICGVLALIFIGMSFKYQALSEEADKKIKYDISKLQSILDNVANLSKCKAPLSVIESNLRDAERLGFRSSELYKEWGKIYYDYGANERDLEKGRELLRKSIDMLEKATLILDDDYMAWFYKYLVYEIMDEKDNEAMCITKIADIAPDNEYGSFCQGHKLYYESISNDIDPKERTRLKRKAITFYSKALTYNPAFVWSYIYQGSLYVEMKHYSEAFKNFTKAIKINPIAQAYNKRGDLYFKMEQYVEALSDFNNAVKLNSNIAFSYIRRGQINARKKKFTEAISEFNKVIKLNPTQYLSYSYRGNVYFQIKQYPEALADFNKAIKLSPYYGYAYNNRGILYYHIGEYKKAIADFEYCQSRGVDNPEIEQYLKLSRMELEMRGK